MPTLDQEFATYKGQGVLVSGQKEIYRGQCFQWFDFVLHDVYGLPYFYAEDAVDIWYNPDSLKNSFDFIPYNPAMPIKKGDFVIYGSGVGSPSGHVSVALQDGQGNNYLGADTNWGHNLTVHAQPHNDSYNQYILGVLRLKGGNMPPVSQQQPDDLTIRLAYNLGLFRQPSDDEIASMRKFNTEQMMRIILESAEHAGIPAPTDYVPYTGAQLFFKK